MLLALALLAAPVQAQAPSPPREAGDPVPKERTDAPPLQPTKIILVGDSTMAPHSGWASAFCARQVKSSVACLNVGRGGRSTRSYRAEGSWDIAMGEAKVPGYRETYVLIQFGHNDQSSRPERWTDMTSEFPANLTRMVAEVRAAGAIPVLLTPLTRREFKDGKLRNTLEPWSDEVRKVAAATGAALLDLNRSSAAAVTRMGPETSLELAQEAPTPEERAAAVVGTTLKPRAAPEVAETPPTDPKAPRGRVSRKFDYTHVGDIGANVFAKLVARDLAAVAPGLRSQLLP
jgi:lysophospholipase L1-like esterase